MTDVLARRRFTVEEFRRMGEVGILPEDERVELIEGEIVMMTPIGPPHAGSVNRLTRLWTSRLGDRAIVQVQNPVRLTLDTEPQPDLALLRPRADFYAKSHPQATDVFLLFPSPVVRRSRPAPSLTSPSRLTTSSANPH